MPETAHFFTPVFYYHPDPDSNTLNRITFNSPMFFSGTPEGAVKQGVYAEVCGFTAVFGVEWAEEWALITWTSGPFVFGDLNPRDADSHLPSMGIAIIDGPLLDAQLKTIRAGK